VPTELLIATATKPLTMSLQANRIRGAIQLCNLLSDKEKI